MPSPSGIRKDSSIFAFGDGGGMPPPYKYVGHINNHLSNYFYNNTSKLPHYVLLL